jgi:hypothetical protein
MWGNDGTTTMEILEDERNIILVYGKTAGRNKDKNMKGKVGQKTPLLDLVSSDFALAI